MEIKNTNFASIEQIAGQYLNQTPQTGRSVQNASFEEILEQKFHSADEQVTELKFSKHAAKRLSDRNITLSEEQMSRLEAGAQKSVQKGIKESLVLMDEYAFIVNTKSNTVVTAMQTDHEEENVYTNIDGAVLV